GSARGGPPVRHRRTDDQGENDSNQPAPEQPRNQQSGQQSGGKDEAIRLDATLVNLPLLVSDRSGRFIPQLSKRDFEIYEDGVKKKTAFFGYEEVPFNCALLVDVSPCVMNSLNAV